MHNIDKKEKEKELSKLIESKKFSEAKQIIDQGADINSPYVNIAYIIANYIISSDHEGYQKILSLGANINSKDGYGRTALFTIIAKCDSPKISVENFIKLGGNINSLTHSGRTALFEAVSIGINRVKSLVEAGTEINTQDDSGTTALIESVTSNPNSIIIEYLLSQNANPNITDENGEGILHHLLKFNYKTPESYNNLSNVFQILRKYNANIETRNKDGKAPIHLVKNLYTAKILVNNGANINLQYKNSRNEECSVISDLLNKYFKEKMPQQEQDLFFFLLKNGADTSQMIQGRSIFDILDSYLQPYSRSPIDKDRLRLLLKR